jgi:hypothetical protein
MDVQTVDDDEPYGLPSAISSNDDSTIIDLSEQDFELIILCCSYRDPTVYKFSGLSLFYKVYAEGRDDELLEAPKVGETVTT